MPEVWKLLGLTLWLERTTIWVNAKVIFVFQTSRTRCDEEPDQAPNRCSRREGQAVFHKFAGFSCGDATKFNFVGDADSTRSAMCFQSKQSSHLDLCPPSADILCTCQWNRTRTISTLRFATKARFWPAKRDGWAPVQVMDVPRERKTGIWTAKISEQSAGQRRWTGCCCITIRTDTCSHMYRTPARSCCLPLIRPSCAHTITLQKNTSCSILFWDQVRKVSFGHEMCLSSALSLPPKFQTNFFSHQRSASWNRFLAAGKIHETTSLNQKNGPFAASEQNSTSLFLFPGSLYCKKMSNTKTGFSQSGIICSCLEEAVQQTWRLFG